MRVNAGRVILDLKGLKGCLSHIPKNVAPDKDKGSYLIKAIFELEHIIKKYERIRAKK